METIFFGGWCVTRIQISAFTLKNTKSFIPKPADGPLMVQFCSEDFEGFHIVPEGLN